jgi:hypothetical protein
MLLCGEVIGLAISATGGFNRPVVTGLAKNAKWLKMPKNQDIV